MNFIMRDLKDYKAPLTVRGWLYNNWHWILLGVAYFVAVYFGGSHV